MMRHIVSHRRPLTRPCGSVVGIRLTRTCSRLEVRSFGVSVPEKPTASWERGAKLVKDTDITNNYLEHIRDTHDPALHLKTIEDELRGTMGKALGKQGEKITRNLVAMKQEYEMYQDLMQDDENNTSMHQVEKCVKRYNELRQLAIKARWELLVHRQAIGFVVNNHNFVYKHYPIPEALPDPCESLNENWVKNGDFKHKSTTPNESTKDWTGQLDWWQRIGRWR